MNPSAGKRRLIRLAGSVGALALALMLASCVAPRPPEEAVRPAPSATVAEKAEREGEFILAAREYERLAETAAGAARQDFVLRAANMLAQAGELHEARQRLAQVPLKGLDPSLAARKRIIEARLLVLQGQNERAARDLSELLLTTRNLDPTLIAEIHGARVQVELALNNPFGAVRSLAAREQYIAGTEAIAANQMQLWKILESQKRALLASELTIARDPVLAGWLELSLAAADHAYNPVGMQAAIEAWKKTNPKHPANEALLTSLAGKLPRFTGRFERVALLLPLSSDLAVAAQAVRDGFMAMHEANHDPDRPNVRIYDIGADPAQSPALYRRAVEEGAQVIVGPLGREASDAIVRAQGIAAPTLLLSHTDENIPGAGSFVFQFGLPPEQEARQVAERAWLDGRRQAAVLYPAGAWGERMRAAFVAHWTRLGGLVVASEAYENPKGDYSESIKKLLNITQSETRKEILAGIVRQKLQFEPRPRQDIDFIFLAADAKRGRLIKPQLNFYHASRVPVYATSHVFSGKNDPVHDLDLDDVLFADMPWMLLSDGKLQLLRETLQHDWPHAQTDLDRLYALGVDSYAILPHLSRISADPSARFTGVTSVLSLDPQGRLNRNLTWAQFRKGLPRLIDKPRTGERLGIETGPGG